ncbi:MAG: efflux RND transporter periplasmic adaptor subunit [Treponema sp.]|nr:efflux RND transporter periplasmic adaptor subunit [Treponema sp.]
MRVRAFLPALCVLFAGLFFSACNDEEGGGRRLLGGGGDTEPIVPVFAVNTIAAAQGPIQDFIGLSGDVIASSVVDAVPEAAGRVEQVFVSIGQRVTRGQAIATVDPSRPGMTFQLNTVTAPVTGTIVMLPVQVGMTIGPGMPVARVASGNTLEIRLFVAERFISRMALGLPAEITLAAWPGEVFYGRIYELSPTIDPMSRTMEVRVRVSQPGDRLRAGMFANVRLITERKENVVKIPASAMVSRFGNQYVYVVEQDLDSPEHNVARRRNITPGILVDGMLEVQSGLEPHEEVVARGQTMLDDGVRVNVIERLTPIGG